MNSIYSKQEYWTTTKRIVLAVGILILLAFFSSCEYNKEEQPLPVGGVNPCDTAVVSFVSDIEPILTSQCATSGCHDGTGDDPNLSTNIYNQLAPSISDGKFKSKVLDARTMPPSSEPPLSAANYQKIKCWFENGHLNN